MKRLDESVSPFSLRFWAKLFNKEELYPEVTIDIDKFIDYENNVPK